MNFTTHLLTTTQPLYLSSTTSAFLAAAARGQVPKPILGRWLANDRLYIHAYIKGASRLLALLDLPDVVATAPEAGGQDASELDAGSVPVTERLLAWLIKALVNVRREEKFFIDVASRFGVDVNLPTAHTSESGSAGSDRRVSSEDKNAGLRAFERLFSAIDITPSQSALLPWLAPAVLFWATEKCYLEAWSGAKAMIPSSAYDTSTSASDADRATNTDLDGGALRTEFIPNWSSPEFRAFVDQLAAIIDDGVNEAIRQHGEAAIKPELERASATWREVLLAENNFWPEEMEEGGSREVPSD
ncbi:hypothetical protein BDP81DRAFT_1437 [Colletotrichum phormii]|uniref:Thiaminase-2/PQQC domain-containing protein n=1 Tax=Colletotrichum phormii TaxID=359342 RepID=A0AAJ0EKI6_9PEZI|nr:uncharacterized protein BDP81DRAFT_1437 [Colletotrichum phormii]KAK1655246.1 hypothetical protein BDP81DRAFT_1437 [Colletotrichum phormii]